MKALLAIPVLFAKAIADFFIGADELTEALRWQRSKAEYLLLMGRNH